jgi:hypothetical protein
MIARERYTMKNRIAIFFKVDKMFLIRLVFVITIAIMLAAVIFAVLLFWSQPQHAANISPFGPGG